MKKVRLWIPVLDMTSNNKNLSQGRKADHEDWREQESLGGGDCRGWSVSSDNEHLLRPR